MIKSELRINEHHFVKSCYRNILIILFRFLVSYMFRITSLHNAEQIDSTPNEIFSFNFGFHFKKYTARMSTIWSDISLLALLHQYRIHTVHFGTSDFYVRTVRNSGIILNYRSDINSNWPMNITLELLIITFDNKAE